jgi:ABC-2 type transport system ATP-binding protein
MPAPSPPFPVLAEPAISVDAVSKRYGRTLALDKVSFDVADKELFALLGPNGAGKTTLLHILCTILFPDSGVARVGGFDVARQPVAARQRLGIVFQEPSLDDRLTVRENLELHGLVYGVPRRLRRQRIEEMLALVELTEWAGRPARTLSSGMKRRLEIARALIHDSEILLLDEPTVGIDAQTRERIWAYLRRLRNERDITVLVTTHYIEEVEGCDRVCIIDGGKVLALDTPEALKRAHGHALLRVAPATPADRQAITERFSDRLTGVPGEELTFASDDAFVAAMLAEFGTRITALRVELPSLETVFLSLTGRELRDRAVDPREQTRAFGQRGGEHTR